MIDATTLEHFGVFGNTTNGRTVFALLDHTISTQGRRALRRRIAAPPATLAELIDLQHAHRAIAAEATDYRAALAGASLGAVEHYLGSTWLLPSRMPVAARLRRWYGAYRADVQCGHDACAALASSASRLAALMRHSTAPLLKRIAARIEETTNADSMTALYGQMRRGRLKTNQLVAFDELARGGAGSALAACIECISDVEALFSVAEATRRHGWTYPVFSDRLRVLGLVHPLLGDAAVRNDSQAPTPPVCSSSRGRTWPASRRS